LQGSECLDVNECESLNGGCGDNKVCTNTQGGHTCGSDCVSGYELSESQCVDVDECAEATSPCAESAASLCLNTVGHYECGAACPDGYAAKDSVCKRTGNSILDFAIALKQDATASEFIHASHIGSATEIELAVPAGSSVSELWVAISSSAGSHFVGPGEGGPIDFTDPLTYTVMAEDGGTRTYTVRVSIAKPHELAAISINGYWGAIRGDLITVAIPANPEGYDLNVAPVFVKHADATVANEPGAFENGKAKDFTVSAGSSTTVYHVTVNVGLDLSSAGDVTLFSLPGQAPLEPPPTAIAIVMPSDTDLATLTPMFEISPKATVWPSASAMTGFQAGVAKLLFVIAQDGTVKPYTVTVTVATGT